MPFPSLPRTWRPTTAILLFALAALPPTATAQLGDYGDAPNGTLAYPSSGVVGQFPTCIGNATGWVAHLAVNNTVHFGPLVDFETNGNGGTCPGATWNNDECFQDGDAGLIKPDGFTITGTATSSYNVVPCVAGAGTPLGAACATVGWGAAAGIDISVTNGWSTIMYVNMLVDWNQDGQWSGSVFCTPGNPIPEHVLVNFPVPPGFSGPLSLLGPPSFAVGPNLGYFWTRFTIGEVPVAAGWNGSHLFDLGETEDYLLAVTATGGGTGVGDLPARQPGLQLEAGAPNPFNPRTVIAYSLDASAPVSLTIHDLAGRLVRTLFAGDQAAGRHEVVWDGTRDDGRITASGVYFVRAESHGAVQTGKLVLLK